MPTLWVLTTHRQPPISTSSSPRASPSLPAPSACHNQLFCPTQEALGGRGEEQGRGVLRGGKKRGRGGAELRRATPWHIRKLVPMRLGSVCETEKERAGYGAQHGDWSLYRSSHIHQIEKPVTLPWGQSFPEQRSLPVPLLNTGLFQAHSSGDSHFAHALCLYSFAKPQHSKSFLYLQDRAGYSQELKDSSGFS